MLSVMMNDGLACFFSVKLPRLKQIKRLNVFCVSDDHLSALMTRTRPARQSWIETAKPHITDITKRYPLLVDLPGAVSSILCTQLFKQFMSLLAVQCLSTSPPGTAPGMGQGA